MNTRLPSLDGRVVTFVTGPWSHPGHAGAVGEMISAVAEGVDGVELTAQATSDGVAIASSTDRTRDGLRRRRISRLPAADLSPDLTTVNSLLAKVPDSAPLLINVADDRVFEAVLAAARRQSASVESRLWLIGHDQADLVRWRPRTDAKLLHATGRRGAGGSIEKLLAAMHGDDLDGVSMPHAEWSGGTIALAHRFGLLAHASGARHSRELAAVIDAGVDAVSGADPVMMAAVANQYYP